jgi:undecaprenyl-diphosphatase
VNPLHAVILGLIEGITEYLPISSTGHLIIAQALLGLNQPEHEHSLNAFTIVIQGGAILAVLGLYRHRVAQMIRGLLGRDAAGLRLAVNIIVAFMPAAVLGVLLDDWIEQHLFFFWPVMAALAIGGIVMIFIGRWQKKFFRGDERDDPHSAREYVDLEHLTWRRALVIGLLQCLALWPGTSRSMATIVGGMAVGLRPRHAAEFSFLLGLPTLGGACCYKLLKNLRADGPNLFDQLGVAAVVIGLVVATISAALAVKWLVNFLNRHGLAAFGWYRLALCAVLAALVLTGRVSIQP